MNLFPGQADDTGGDPSDAGAPPHLPEDVAGLISGMMYLSEGESGLELLPDGEAEDLPALQHLIEVRHGIPPAAQTIIPGAEFLGAIQAASDPSDPVMTEYARTWDGLFALLRGNTKDVSVIRAGKVEVQIYIAAFGSAKPVIIHTSATET